MKFAINTGLKVYEMNSYKSDDINCPVIKYTAILIPGVSSCKGIPNISTDCRSLTLDTSTSG